MVMADPLWLSLARGELGVIETPGPKSNPEILEMFKDAGHPEINSEETAWCAAFCGSMLHRAGIKPSGSLMARSYLTWGQKLDAPKVGCIAVLWRGSPSSPTGHVGFVASFTADSIELLGGNQGAAGVVSIEHFPRSRVLGFRWPEGGHELGAKPGAESKKPLQNSSAPLGASGPVLAGKPPTNSTKGTTRMNPISALVALINVLVPFKINDASQPVPVPGAGTIVSPVTTITNALGMIIGALLISRGVDTSTATTIGAGTVGLIASLLNQLHLTGGANVNTLSQQDKD